MKNWVSATHSRCLGRQHKDPLQQNQSPSPPTLSHSASKRLTRELQDSSGGVLERVVVLDRLQELVAGCSWRRERREYSRQS